VVKKWQRKGKVPAPFLIFVVLVNPSFFLFRGRMIGNHFSGMSFGIVMLSHRCFIYIALRSVRTQREDFTPAERQRNARAVAADRRRMKSGVEHIKLQTRREITARSLSLLICRRVVVEVIRCEPKSHNYTFSKRIIFDCYYSQFE